MSLNELNLNLLLIIICAAKQYCHSPNSTTTQLNITKVGFDTKITLQQHHYHPPPGTQHHQYLSFKGRFLGSTASITTTTIMTTKTTTTITFHLILTYFDKILKLGFWINININNNNNNKNNNKNDNNKIQAITDKI